MIKFQNTIIIVLVLIASSVNAQNYKFGKVSLEELKEKVYANDSSASAAVLFRSVNVKFNYIQNVGFKVVTYVHERVKIYNKNGFRHATVSEYLYKNGSSKEMLSDVKAYTYNLVGDKIVKDKMEKSGRFLTSLNKYRNEEKFTLPSIKEGSVIEYEYHITSPIYYSMGEISLQYDIPIKRMEISVATPQYFTFKPNMKGYLPLTPTYKTYMEELEFVDKREVSQQTHRHNYFEKSKLSYQITTTNYVMNDVHALQEEPYVNDMDNYRSAVNYELQYVHYPGSVRESYTTTWEKVIKKIYENDDFGGQLKYNKYYSNDLDAIVNNSSTNAELAGNIYFNIQNRMTWNGLKGHTTDQGVKEAYKKKSGNVADINLILVSMLQSAGLNANPVLLSTRDHGVPLFPTIDGFNYVVASVQIEGTTVLLDASNKFAEPNLLPTRTLNWYGKMIQEDGTFNDVNLFPKKISKKIKSLSVNLSKTGDLEGKGRLTYTDYEAYLFRNKNASTSEDEYLENLENDNAGMEISDYQVKNKMTIGNPIVESFVFNLENQADVIGDRIYFTPLFHLALNENPFKLEQRSYPIDFVYPQQERCMINITLPVGYKVISKPTNVSLVLKDKQGSFKYQIVENGNSLQVIVDINLNQAVFSSEYYTDLKELFKNAIEKQTEKVVLAKM